MFVLLQLQRLNKQVLCSLAFACSLGLLRLGSHVRALPGRTGRLLQGSQVRRRIRSSAQVTPGFWQGRHHCELFAPCECYSVLNLGKFQAHSRTRTLPLGELLDQLPALQKLLLRLISCQVYCFRKWNCVNPSSWNKKTLLSLKNKKLC